MSAQGTYSLPPVASVCVCPLMLLRASPLCRDLERNQLFYVRVSSWLLRLAPVARGGPDVPECFPNEEGTRGVPPSKAGYARRVCGAGVPRLCLRSPSPCPPPPTHTCSCPRWLPLPCCPVGVTLLQATFRGRKERSRVFGDLLVSPLRGIKLADKELFSKMDVVGAWCARSVDARLCRSMDCVTGAVSRGLGLVCVADGGLGGCLTWLPTLGHQTVSPRPSAPTTAHDDVLPGMSLVLPPVQYVTLELVCDGECRQFGVFWCVPMCFLAAVPSRCPCCALCACGIEPSDAAGVKLASDRSVVVMKVGGWMDG
jgi:hypothetical protein